MERHVKIKPAGKVILVLLALGIGAGIFTALKPERKVTASAVPLAADIPTSSGGTSDVAVNTGQVELPDTQPAV